MLRLECHVTAFFDMIGRDIWGKSCMLCRAEFMFYFDTYRNERYRRNIFGYFVTKGKVAVICRPSNTIKFLECFEKCMGDKKFDNEMFLLGNFNIDFLHNDKNISK